MSVNTTNVRKLGVWPRMTERRVDAAIFAAAQKEYLRDMRRLETAIEAFCLTIVTVLASLFLFN